MGWTFDCSPMRLADFLKERCQREDYRAKDGNLYHRECLAHKYVMYTPSRGTLWTVWEYTVVGCDGTVTKDERYIGCDLIQYGFGGQGCYWGYKDMEEHSGPNECNCPLSYLAMVPEPGPCTCKGETGHCSNCWASNWRSRVRAYHQRRTDQRQLLRELKIGDRVYLSGAVIDSAVVQQIKPKLVADHYRIPTKLIDVQKTREALAGGL